MTNPKTRVLARTEWRDVFEVFTRDHLQRQGATATLELLSPDFGDQTDDQPVPLVAIAWDAESGALDVLLEELDPLAFRPRSIAVIECDDGFIEEIEIVQDEGVRELLHVHRREPLSLFQR